MTTKITQSEYKYKGRIYTAWLYYNDGIPEVAIMDDTGYDVSLKTAVLEEGEFIEGSDFTIHSADPEEYIHQCFLSF